MTDTERIIRLQSQINIISGYELGLYNGLELALSVLENTDPVFKEAKDEMCELRD